jgi:poly-gamma-glutamate capsule biosynthesis protein CapA/YwtB (metallophosphatase superfamily)
MRKIFGFVDCGMRILLITVLFTSSLMAVAQDTTRLSLLFLGDIMQHDSQITDAYDRSLKKYNYDPCFKFIKPYTQAADLAIGNLELTLAGPPYKGYPQFSAPDELLLALKKMGMDVLVTANNHCVDTGKKGLERTIKMLDSLDIPHTGTFADEVSKLNEHPLLIEKNGFTLALLNYTYGTNGLPVTKPNIVNLIDTAAMSKDLKKAKTLKPDVIIVFTHWGSEYQSLPSKWQKDVAAHCFKHGAQLVIGAHPHVLQPMEWRKDKNQLVAYSLGNFISGQRKRYTDGGALVTIGLEKILYGEDSAVTMIDTANYLLEWVYRTADAEKNYYVLPVGVFEHDTTGFIKDAASREAFRIFADDSRALYKKHNINITESTNVPADTLMNYKVLFLTANAGQSNSVVKMPQLPYGVETEKDDAGNLFFFSGNFKELQEAENYRTKLVNQFGYKDARIVTFVNDTSVE